MKIHQGGNRPPLPPPPRPTVSLAPILTRTGLCSDCQVPAIMTDDGFYKVCPRCYCVLWTRLTEDLAKKRVEDAAKRKAAQEEAGRQRHLLHAEKARLRAEKLTLSPPPKMDDSK